MQVEVLGPIRAEASGADVELGGPQQRLVLALLASAAGRVVTTDQLVDRIWGEHVPGNARKTIQVHVSRLRKALGDPGAIESSGGGYRLRPDVAVDAAEFERLAGQARRLLADDPRRAADILDEALALWRGPPFADIRDEEAVHAECVRLEGLLLVAEEDRLEAMVRSGRAGAAVAELESLIERHPGRERLRALHMLALYRTGRQPEALAVFQAFKQALAEEHGLDPSDELARLELQILQQDPALGPTEAVTPGEGTRAPPLPAELTSFVGRTAELAAAAELLDRHRLVTITGAGGVGKTRLALRLGMETGPRYPHGVWLVELAPLADAELVVEEVAGVLGIEPVPDTPTVDSVASWIGDRRLLLLLDNCEHRVAAVADLVAHLLRACPGLRILATSRERLDAPGEAAYRLPSLAVPDDGQDLLTFDSVALFAERAAAARPGFDAGAAESPHVVSICRRLDGIPLAIELAAARIRVMSPAQIAARLDERFSLLVGPQRAAVDRQQTLAATIDWSYELLDGDERLLFERLSVFTGGFGLEAAEVVCSADPLTPATVLDLLAALVDKSMVNLDDGQAGETRYQVLETLRHYAADKLAARAEAGELGGRHMEYFTAFGAQIQATYRAGDLPTALAMYRDDEDNLRAALRFALDHGHVEHAARIVGEVFWFWYHLGACREGIDWCRQVFAGEPDLPDEVLAPALHAYGSLLGGWEQPAAGAEILARQVELRRKMDDPVRLGAALNNLGNMWNDLGRAQEAEAALGEAIEVLRGAGHAPTLTLISLGSRYRRTGEYEQAEALYEEALDEAQGVDDTYAVAVALCYMGQCEARLGRPAEARRLLEDARARFADLGIRPGLMECDIQLAVVDRSDGLGADAARRLLAALETPDAHWYLSAKSWVLQVAASIVDDPQAAVELLGAAQAYYDGIEEVQPQWVYDDLAAATDGWRSAMDERAFASRMAVGRSLAPPAAVTLGRRALKALLAGTGEAK